MSQNDAQKGMTTVQDRAALLVAEDALSNEQIAAECGVTRRTVDRWKVQSEFIAAVDAHRTRWREEIERAGIANRQNRVDALNDRWRKM
jgi:transposase